LAAKSHDAERVARSKRHHVVDRHAGEKRPDAIADVQTRFECPQQEPPAHDAHRVTGGHEGQGKDDGGDRRAGERPAQRVPVQPAHEQPDETRSRGHAD